MKALALVGDLDQQHERLIVAALDAFHKARAANDMQAAADRWSEFVELVGQRSFEQVEKMEKKRGLA